MDGKTKAERIRRILDKVPKNYVLPSSSKWEWHEDGNETSVQIRLSNRGMPDLWFSWTFVEEKKNGNSTS